MVSSLLPTRTNFCSADTGNPISSESIGGGNDVAMGVIETSLAALQAGSALATNVPFISPVASLILQALKMRGVRERLVFQYVSCVNILCDIGSEAVQGRMGRSDG